MTLEELRDLFSDMLSKNMRPMLCDTKVPKYNASVPCGDPTLCYEEDMENMLLPKGLLSMHPEFMLPVKGDSMVGAGITAGDMVKVIGDVTPYDGDIVLACVNGEYTLKTFCEDEKGMKWLLPQNERYQPILLEENTSARIYGRVKEVVKQTVRMSYRDCLKIINRAKQASKDKNIVTREMAERAIREIAEMVKQGRQWYAVHRALEEKDVIDEDDYTGVCKMIAEQVPFHKHLHMADELQRMAVLSFRKPVRQWNPKDAPVKGKRFTDYQQIGLRMLALLEGE